MMDRFVQGFLADVFLIAGTFLALGVSWMCWHGAEILEPSLIAMMLSITGIGLKRTFRE